MIYSGNAYFTKRKDKVVSENYNGEYEFVNSSNPEFYSDIHSKYSNKEMYRYVFMIDARSSIFGPESPMAGDSPSVSVKVYDRLKNEFYHSKKVSVNYFNFSKEYLKKLDQQRIINGG